MEEYAYDYTKCKFPDIKNYTNNVIPMKDLFNMMAGTSTGSILASGLSYPNNNS
jgi:patatin-like phospholipase/acyl hydrolase